MAAEPVSAVCQGADRASNRPCVDSQVLHYLFIEEVLVCSSNDDAAE